MLEAGATLAFWHPLLLKGCFLLELWQAGTVIFIPQGWLHATLNLDDTVGISMELGPSGL